MLITQPLRFHPEHLTRPTVGGIDVVTTLEHFAIVTYAVEPEALTRHLMPRFEPACIKLADGTVRALVSVVPFHDRAFRAAGFPSPRLSFGQTNYRAYIVDRETSLQCVWFFGTTLDSITVMVPRHLWKLPWHRGRIQFSCELDADGARYRRYEMTTRSTWAPVELALEDIGIPIDHLDGFPNLDTGVLILTHPLTGFYRRRDGALGSYAVWHDRLTPHAGICRHARFGLLDRLGLVRFEEQDHPYSVMIQPRTEFTIYLPPRRLH
jgi:hypothetical protein